MYRIGHSVDTPNMKMKIHFNNADYAKKMANKMQRLATCLPLAILFEKPEAKSDTGSSEKEKYKTFNIKMSKKEKDTESVPKI